MAAVVSLTAAMEAASVVSTALLVEAACVDAVLTLAA